MAVLRESPWYQEILEEGTHLGLERGLGQSLLRILRYRFGQVPEPLQQRIQACNSQQLHELQDVALEAESLDAFARQLP